MENQSIKLSFKIITGIRQPPTTHKLINAAKWTLAGNLFAFFVPKDHFINVDTETCNSGLGKDSKERENFSIIVS